jgi:hypothetical protein
MDSSAVKFKHRGHASVEITKAGFSLLLDPWFGTNDHFGSFHAFPPILVPSEAEIANVSAIHISHIHKDHFCPKTLSRFSRTTPVFIAQYPDKKFLNEVRACGFQDVREVPQAPATTACGPFQLSALSNGPGAPTFDSILIVSDGGSNYLFNNDCTIPDRQYEFIRMFFGRFTGCFVGHFVFTPEPTCYDFSRCETMKSPASTIEMIKMQKERNERQISQTLAALKPDWFVPYADEIRLLNRDLAIHNRMFTRFAEVEKIPTHGARLIRMQLGKSINQRGETLEPGSAATEVPAESDLKPPLFQATARVQELEDRSKEITSQFVHAIKKNRPAAKERLEFEIILTALDGDFCFTVISDPEETRAIDVDLSERQDRRPDMSLRYPSKAVEHVLDGRMTFQNIHYAYAFEATVFRTVAPLAHYFVHRWT